MNNLLTDRQLFLKRVLDLTLSVVLLVPVCIVVLICFIIACFDTHSFGLFFQSRVGMGGRLFTIIKLKTMKDSMHKSSHITISTDGRISRVGALLRKYKIDELPQLFNILSGSMSFVGPRPDVSGFADCLTNDDRSLLTVPPGVTSLASLAYRNEEVLLSEVTNPYQYNKDVIWPRKVKLNIHYYSEWSPVKDLKLIFRTVSTLLFGDLHQHLPRGLQFYSITDYFKRFGWALIRPFLVFHRGLHGVSVISCCESLAQMCHPEFGFILLCE